MTRTVERKYPAPESSPETQAFWDAAKDGKLLLGYCRGTGDYYYYPRALSPFTLSDDTEMREARGTGTIYSFSVMRRGPNTPYVLAYVTLDEGPAVLTNIVDADADALSIGQKVKLRWLETEGAPLPAFTPDA